MGGGGVTKNKHSMWIARVNDLGWGVVAYFKTQLAIVHASLRMAQVIANETHFLFQLW